MNQFDRWDVTVQYRGTDDGYYIKRLAYTAGAPGDDQWTVTGIFLNAATADPEVFEPSILNPEEEAVLQLKLNPGVKAGSTNLVTIVAPNGVSIPIIFNG